MKKFLIIFVLCFFCSNVAFSKPEMYYCLEEGSTGFKADGKGGYNQTNWVKEKFKVKVDLENLTVSSSFKDLFIDANCHWRTEGVDMSCFDRIRDKSLRIQRVDENFNSFVFTFASFGMLPIKSRQNDLTILYGNCEKF